MYTREIAENLSLELQKADAKCQAECQAWGVRDLGHTANNSSNVQLAAKLTPGFKLICFAHTANLDLVV